LKDPKSVTGEHCFEDYNRPVRYAYVAVLSTTQVAAAFGDGAGPTALPDDHQVFHR